MVYGLVGKINKSRSFAFLISINFNMFTVPLKLYYDDKNNNNELYDKIVSISKGFMSFINEYTRNLYHIDSMIALKHYAQNTQVKQSNNNKVLIYHSIKIPICNIKTGYIFKLIPYSCMKQKYNYYDKNPNYKTLGNIHTIKPITLTHFNILKNIIQIDNSISVNEWKLLKSIRAKNEKIQRSTKSLLVSNAKGLNRV